MNDHVFLGARSRQHSVRYLLRWLPLVFVFAVGCSRTLPPTANPEKAKATLSTALDAWKDGATAESLQARQPAIYFNDPEWNGSNRLVKYEFDSEQANGMGWRCIVLLTVESGNGKSRQRKASYVIDTDPALVIVREP